MPEMKSRNPVLLREGQYAGFHEAPTATAATAADQATLEHLETTYQAPAAGGSGARLGIDDVVVKTALMFVLLLVGAVVGWNTAEQYPGIWIAAAVVGLILGLVNAFKRNVSPILVMAYALVQGVFLGGISSYYEEAYPGVVVQAVTGTLVAFGVMLALYQTKIIKVTPRFQKMMLIALISYAVIGLFSLISAFFGVGEGWGFYGVGALGVGLCMIGVALAAFTLVLDFEAIAQSINAGLPERESWRLAFGLMMTLIWLYLELLRLLAILRGD